ncbi:MAG TPA: collagen-binding domain-containing protein, partial [Patescibacteria group bacterium]|nr:collagen-binding domain-containing protein [Patescibacteria group bacterium]
NAEIYGKASTGPGGNIDIQKGTVGSLAYHASGKTGIESGWSADDMNVYFPDVNPTSPGLEVNNLNIGIHFPSWPTVEGGVPVTYDYRSGGGTYTLKNGLTLNNKKLYIAADTTLTVEGNISISGQGAIVIAPTARLEIYMKGATAYLGGNGIVNRGGKASNFSYWGLPTNTEVTIQGNGDFIGTIYAPQATAKFGGGGTTGDDFSGALVANRITLGGHYKFHYDESLGAFGPRRGYTIITWNETGWNKM